MTATPVCDLSQRDLHVWSLPNTAPEEVAARFQSLLAADEKDRAARFRFEHLRRSYLVTRGALRCLLGRYLHVAPASIQFHYGAKGKPSVPSAANLQFNATHSGGQAAFAFTLGVEVGIDIEHIRPLSDAESIAARFFCQEEAAEIISLPPHDREHAFYRCWTRKESYIKAIGDGLSAPLDNFHVTIQKNHQPSFLHIAGDTTVANTWTLHDLCLDPNYTAALAYNDQPRPLSLFHLADPSVLL